MVYVAAGELPIHSFTAFWVKKHHTHHYNDNIEQLDQPYHSDLAQIKAVSSTAEVHDSLVRPLD